MSDADQIGDGTVDLSRCADPEDAARAVCTYLRSTWNAGGECVVTDPGETEKRRGARGWMVSWESGPSEWATHLTGGDSLMTGEMPSVAVAAEIVGFREADGWTAEPYHSFDIVFYGGGDE